ncbi:MAG: ferritin-like domain-containing protein [Myxococcota bacterium]
MGATLAGLLGIACGPSTSGGEDVMAGGTGSEDTGGGTLAMGESGTTSAVSSCAPPLSDASCDGDAPWIVGAQERQGWMQCGNGLAHRVSADACELPAADQCMLEAGETGEQTSGECSVDADCSDAAHGRCHLFGMLAECGCDYACETDADCGDDQACLCNGSRSQCVPADCRVDADCGEGSACTLETADSSCGVTDVRMTCTTPADACVSTGGCDFGEECVKDDDECGFQCVQSADACADAGRPFIVADEHRTAPMRRGGGWCEPSQTLADSLRTLSPELRDHVAQHWIRSGLAEHASVASFARFIMQLLALGAPSDLVEQAQSAVADEIDHARRCFAVASQYAEQRVGPGRLPMDAALDGDQDLVSVTAAVIREGCIGETLAAAEVAEAAQWAEHPELRDTLSAIADDELRHAALAWRFVEWALSQATTTEQAAIFATIDDAVDGVRHTPVRGDAIVPEARRHGVLSPEDRAVVHAKALASVVIPCAHNLRELRGSARQSAVVTF